MSNENTDNAGAAGAAGNAGDARGVLARALAAAGAAAFEWRADADEMAWSDGSRALGVGDASDWAQFRALFVDPDRPRVDSLRDGVPVVVVRLEHDGGAFRRVRLRAAWGEGPDGARCFAGLVTPAFGAAGEGDEHGRLGFEPALREAAEALDFETWYQPIVALKTGEVDGLEALVRWDCQGRGILPPDDFLPLLDELGHMGRLGAWMRSAAARQLARWRDETDGPKLDHVSVNITAQELEEPELVAGVAALIRGLELGPGVLRLEITEGEVMRDADRAARVLGELKSVGASLALDDFGSGHASFAWLERFPVDVLKIDRYFVRTLHASDGSQKIVGSITALAHELGLKVVAEGVEDESSARRLAELGCDYGQGFWFAPPLKQTEIETLLQNWDVATFRN